MEREKNCFVIISFGIKTEYSTGRQLNMDRTYDSLLKPVFDELGIKCFRAKDITHSGVIDMPMYEWIYKADIVVADISTLNPNVLYELGIRHALKPYTTIVIAEDGYDKIPFDLSHLVIDPLYHHLGEDVGVQEAKRFSIELKKKLTEIINKPQNDSPVYTFLRGLKEPVFSNEEIDKIVQDSEETQSLSKLSILAETHKQNRRYSKAREIFMLALKSNPKDVFLIQRLALVTYKNKYPDTLTSLNAALDILKPLMPESSTDPETLGLCGAIYKRIFEETADLNYLEKSIWFYERGFYIKQDYYNAINVAFLYSLASTLREDKLESIADNILGLRIRKKTIEICDNIVKSTDFDQRGDKAWVFFSLAEAYFGIGNLTSSNEMERKGIESATGSFEYESYKTQKDKLEAILDIYNEKWRN